MRSRTSFELRIRRQRFPSDLHRDAPRAPRELFHGCRLFQAVRVVLRRRRRAGLDWVADQLPEGSAGGRLPLSDTRPTRQCAPAFSRLHTGDQLASRKPEFYNALTTNCTTSILTHTRVNQGGLPLSWKVLLSGYIPQYLYERSGIDTSLPLEELKRRSHINAAALGGGHCAGFFTTHQGGIADASATTVPLALKQRSAKFQCSNVQEE